MGLQKSTHSWRTISIPTPSQNPEISIAAAPEPLLGQVHSTKSKFKLLPTAFLFSFLLPLQTQLGKLIIDYDFAIPVKPWIPAVYPRGSDVRTNCVIWPWF